jgi:hypothetical protein
MALGTTFGADPEAIQRKATALVHEADQAVASNHNSEAEVGYKAAIAECNLLPPEKYHCKTDVQWKLGRFYSHVNDRSNGEATYKQRLDTLVANQKAGAPPDLDIGIALLDLQSALSYPTDTSRDADETAYMEQARRFYEQCKAGFPDLRNICDRRLADVEGLHGSLFTLKKRFDEAAPFLKAVTDRPDSGVRKEVLTGALKGYATILILQGRVAEAQVFVQRAQRLETVQK